MGQWRAARRAGARSGHRACGGGGGLGGGARFSPLPPCPAFLGLSPRFPPGPSPDLPSETLTGLRLDVEEMALTVPNQRRKLEAVLEAVNRSLQAEDQPLKWSMDGMWGLGWGGVPGRAGEPGSLCSTGLLFPLPLGWGHPGGFRGASRAKSCTPFRAKSPTRFCAPEVSPQQSPRPCNGINAVNEAPTV